MSSPAQSPQGAQSVLSSKPLVFNKLRNSFGAVPTSSTPAADVPADSSIPNPVVSPVLDQSKVDLVDKLFTNQTKSDMSVKANSPVISAPTPPASQTLSPSVPMVVQPKPSVSPTPITQAALPKNQNFPPLPSVDKLSAVPEPAVSEKPSEPQKEKDEFSSDFLTKLLPEDEFSSPLPAAVPTAVNQMADASLNPPQAVSSTVKEVAPSVLTIETPQVDVSPGLQYVETEPNLVPPEVESFLTHVENHHEQLPQEIVIADQSDTGAIVQPMAQPVVVLPITSEIEKNGARKDSTFSVRWLIEWSRKVMKMFAGKIVYRTSS